MKHHKMKKLFYLLFICISTLQLSSQTIEEIKNADTLFIYFKPSSNFKKIIKKSSTSNLLTCNYFYFIFRKKEEYVFFSSCDGINDTEPNTRVVNKRELKKRVVLKEPLIRQIGFKNLGVKYIFREKVLYIVENTINKKERKITRVKLFSSYQFEDVDIINDERTDH